MCAFKSNRSKKSTVATVNKLIESYIPSASTIQNNTNDDEKKYVKVVADDFSGHGPGASKIARIRMQTKRMRGQRKLQRKMKSIEKRQRKAVIRKHLETRKEVELLGKLASGDKQTVGNLVNENVSRLNLLKPNNQHEIIALEEEILYSSYLKRNVQKVGEKSLKQVQFEGKVSNGLVSVPGLTPGLAPVDSFDAFDDSDDESGEEARPLPSGFKDDYDDYH